jgi:hypothetical protein
MSMDFEDMKKTVRDGINLIDTQAKLIEGQRAYIERLQEQNDALRRELGRYKLLGDLKSDIEQLGLSAFLRKQI